MNTIARKPRTIINRSLLAAVCSFSIFTSSIVMAAGLASPYRDHKHGAVEINDKVMSGEVASEQKGWNHPQSFRASRHFSKTKFGKATKFSLKSHEGYTGKFRPRPHRSSVSHLLK